ncbi:MAG TPA: hypothetical protein VFY47_09610 [Thermoleophilaceae bacterium]|nr:hypothetical protein [Thermoleophilaceae bacterium]
MSERWVPLLAAAVGLLGGMGGAYVGGTLANEGQQDRFEAERKAETRNIRLDAYVDFLKACETAFYIDETFSRAEKTRLTGELSAALARAALVTSSADVPPAAGTLAEACREDDDDPVARGPGIRFLEAAHPELDTDD